LGIYFLLAYQTYAPPSLLYYTIYGKSLEEVREISLEIGMLGQYGLDINDIKETHVLRALTGEDILCAGSAVHHARGLSRRASRGWISRWNWARCERWRRYEEGLIALQFRVVNRTLKVFRGQRDGRVQFDFHDGEQGALEVSGRGEGGGAKVKEE